MLCVRQRHAAPEVLLGLILKKSCNNSALLLSSAPGQELIAIILCQPASSGNNGAQEAKASSRPPNPPYSAMPIAACRSVTSPPSVLAGCQIASKPTGHREPQGYPP